MIEKLAIYTVGGARYLGIMEERMLKSSVRMQSSFEDTVVSWILHRNLDELEEVELCDGEGYTKKALTVANRRLVKKEWEDFEEAAKYAIKRLENKCYLDKF